MARLAFEIKVAIRTLVRSRFVSVLALIAFALGIGVTTAVFSIFNAVLVSPLPYPDPDRLVAVYDTQPACKTCPASFPKYMDWKERNQAFAAIGGSANAQFVLTGSGDPERIRAVTATASLVDVFGVRPALGRWFTPEEDQPGGRKVAVLDHTFWQQRFGGRETVIGSKIVLNGDPYEVIGVMPATFSHRAAKVFVPLQRKLDPATRGSHFMPVVARLKPGVPVERAAVDMRQLGDTLAREFGTNHGVDVRSYTEVIVGNVRAPLRVLLGAVLLVLLISCANVANLLLASAVGRRRELAIRLALGASQRDLARQLVLEAMLLALAGGLLGLLLAEGLLRSFLVLAATELPRANTVHIDAAVLAFAAAVTTLVGLLCGLWPLVRLRSRQLVSAVREGDVRSGTGGRRVGNGLVVVEIAVAFALLVGASLLVKNVILLQKRDAGVRTDHIVAFDLAPSGPRYQAPERAVQLYRDLYARLTQIGNVESAGMTSHLPMFNFGWNGEMNVEGGNPWGPNDAPLVEYRWIYGDYLRTMGVPLLQGRPLDARDGRGSRTVLINHVTAEKFWPGKDPIGRHFGQGRDMTHWYEVVGVIGDIRSFGLAQKPPYEFYRSIEQSPFTAMTVVLRTRGGDPTAVVPTARQIVKSLDDSLPVSQVQTMEAVASQSIAQPRLLSALTALFGVLAGVLAMVGVYGVTAYNVRRQQREFGIRLALGAAPRVVRALVVGRGLVLSGTGIAAGAAGAWMLTRVLESMLNDVKPTDARVFIGTAIGVFVVALAASYLPARAAGRVDPIVVLRDS
ncbi:MAG: hypothetical protein A3H96_12840 [Acidobacteria bacterium RIFCSPLOWO2_02_FULL_67_36]|nr:MAG: hypothetical protein A3H96_12840 [Acidobacteria bacterium RIFCSPLOWO2_02_FULL_67_36]